MFIGIGSHSILADIFCMHFLHLQMQGHDRWSFTCSTGAVVFIFWVKQALQDKVSENTRRLFPPGKIYHFVYKQPGRSGHRPIRARVVPSAKNRFERLVLSASGTINNHFILALTKHLKVFIDSNHFS